MAIPVSSEANAGETDIVKPSTSSFITKMTGIEGVQGLAEFHVKTMPKLAHGAQFEALLQSNLGEVARLYVGDSGLRGALAEQVPALSKELAQSVADGQISAGAVRRAHAIFREIAASRDASVALRDAIDGAIPLVESDAAQYNAGSRAAAAPTTLLVKPSAGVRGVKQVRDLAVANGAIVKQCWPQIGWCAVSAPAGDVALVRRGLEGSSAVQAVEQPGSLKAQGEQTAAALKEPNDPMYPQQWGYPKVSAPTAWGTRTDANKVIMADIDTGGDLAHEDLKDNLWKNIKDIPDNGIDDDGNGYIDDNKGGWDWVSSDNEPQDDNNHGSHTSGTVGASGSNRKGVTGMAWRVKLMELKFLNSCGSGSYDNAISAILYAADNGAKVINASWGGPDFSQALSDAIKYFGGKGGLFVAAAANDSSDNDTKPVYPASFSLSNILAVAATDSNDNLANFSNYGKKSVDVAAPGVDILSTVVGGYDQMSGTSMATPHVAGLAALIKAKHPSWTYSRVKSAIMGSVDKLSALEGKVASGGRINAAKALAN